jgi:molecular chaperone HtpG
VRDSGIGMTREELVENLGTIAHSGVAAFLESVQDAQGPAADLIGRFGVGFYSAFMVADEVRVRSRSYRPDATPYEWVSSAGNSFTIAPVEANLPGEGAAQRGTSVVVKLKEDAAEFATQWKLEQIILKHSNYVPFAIYLGGREVNLKTALWRQMPAEVTEEKQHEFYRQLTLDTEKPLASMQLNTDAPVQVYALLYIPSRRDTGPFRVKTDYGIRLYTKKVLIQEQAKDLLPPYFRFVEGVVDTEELPLNVSRETVQSSRAMERVRKVLENRVFKELSRLANEAPESYARFWEEFGVYIKEGVTTDLAGRDRLMPLLRFHSSRSENGGLVSLAEYVGRMKEDQPAIYYLLGEDLTSVASSPHLDSLRANNLEVLYLVDPVDGLMMASLPDYGGKPFKGADDPNTQLPSFDEATSESPLPIKDLDRLKERCVDVLGDRIAQVRDTRALRNSPCRLVSPDDAPSREMQRVYRMLNRDYEVPRKILELNPRHPLIQNLAWLVVNRPQEPLINLAIEQLYENGLLIEGIHPNAAAMAPRIQSLLEMAAGTLRSGEGKEPD